MKMKKRITCAVAAALTVASILSGCSGSGEGNATTARSLIAGFEQDNSNIPVLVKTSEHGGTYAFNGRRTAVWGVENDQWQTVSKNRANFHKYLEGSAYVNANTIALHSPWVVMEPEKDVYDFSDFDYCVEQARHEGFKLVIYFTSVNYAAGDTTFVPAYILNDTATYSRIKMDELEGKSMIPLCTADPDTLEREKLILEKFFAHLREINTDGIVLSVNIGSEVDFMHELNLGGSNKNLDIRCHCENCEKLYTPDKGNLEYMTESFANYTKTLIDAAAAVYDIPIYTPVAALTYWPGGRFVEQPDYIKKVVNRDNHVVCPSVAPTMTAELYRKEMDQFVAIDGNVAFASGIDTGWSNLPFNNQLQLAIAPWLTLFEYDGLGAIYWDHPNMTVTRTPGTREKLRTGWGPLRAAEYFISAVKGIDQVTTYWTYEEKEHEAMLGNYKVEVAQESDSNNGYGILIDSKELAFSATTYQEETTTITVIGTGSMKKYTYETGCYDDNGNWVKAGEFTPEIEDKTVTFTINGDSGNAASCVYRICSK